MRFKLILFFTLVLMPCCQLFAQEDILDTYDHETIYIHHSILGDGFVKNGQIIDIGPFGSNLAKEMAGSKYALAEMHKARKYKTLSFLTMLMAGTFQITSVVLAFRDGDGSADDIASIVIGGLCGIMADAFDRLSSASMNRAVWLYNRDIVSGNVRE